MKTVIKAGKIVNCDGILENGYVAVDSDKIVYVGKENPCGSCDSLIDAADMIVFPGGIDPHVHMNDPGDTESEDFGTGTAGAIAGGTTTLLEMPQTVPLVADEKSFAEKKAEIASKALANFGLWAAATPQNMYALSALDDMGAIGFKSFLSHSGYCPKVNLGQLYEIMQSVRAMDSVLGVHCENEDIADALRKSLPAESEDNRLEFAAERGPVVETVAALGALKLAQETKVKLNLLHTSVPEVAEAAFALKKEGCPVAVETAPHYLLLDKTALEKYGAYAKCAPALRDRTLVEELWIKLREKKIDFLGSDHCNYTWEEKMGRGFWKAPNGITGVQTMIPAFYDSFVAERGGSLCDFAALTSRNAALRFGLLGKGYIGAGFDADLFILDPAGSWTVKAEDLFYKVKWSPYEGRRFRGRVVLTMVNGKIAYRQGEITAEPGSGRFLSRRQ